MEKCFLKAKAVRKLCRLQVLPFLYLVCVGTCKDFYGVKIGIISIFEWQHCSEVSLKQLEKFKYLEVAFTSNGRQDVQFDVRLGKASC